jgi:hypothetical protein
MRSLRPLFAILVVVSAGCSDDRPASSSPYPSPSETDRANSRILAECLTGEIRAPLQLAFDIASELNLIQYLYAHEHPQIENIIIPTAMSLEIEFDDSTYERVASGKYAEWNDLLEEYEVNSWRFSSTLRHVVLGFREALNLCSLAFLFRELPGVREVDVVGPIGEYDTVFIKGTDQRREYLYFYGEGDCLVGCVYREYRYFRFVDYTSIPQFVGVFKSTDGALPPWWNEAQVFFEECKCQHPDSLSSSGRPWGMTGHH